MTVRLVTSDGIAVEDGAAKKSNPDLTVFTFAVYKGHIAAAVNGQTARPGAAVIALADIIAKLVDDSEARTALANWPNPGATR